MCVCANKFAAKAWYIRFFDEVRESCLLNSPSIGVPFWGTMSGSVSGDRVSMSETILGTIRAGSQKWIPSLVAATA